MAMLDSISSWVPFHCKIPNKPTGP